MKVETTAVPMATVYTCSVCGVRWVERHECPSVNRSTSAPRLRVAVAAYDEQEG